METYVVIMLTFETAMSRLLRSAQTRVANDASHSYPRASDHCDFTDHPIFGGVAPSFAPPSRLNCVLTMFLLFLSLYGL